MNRLKNALLTSLFLLCTTIGVYADGGDPYEKMFNNAREFALTYPQEKVFLHLDNTSYTQGDTIWYKAYVVLAANNQPTNVSKPLYVELLDQLGNIVEQQIVEINNGTAAGQIPLTNTFLSGYFELRAYTKWMLSMPEPQYYSRVLPVYRKEMGENSGKRQLADYEQRGSVSQRPKSKEETINVNFYPEGGRLIKGVPCMVAFEVTAADSGLINTEGQFHDGANVAPVRSLYDGIGTFDYTPSDDKAYVEMEYKGKNRRFELPKAEDSGVTLALEGGADKVEVSVLRNAATADTAVALFLFSQGIPVFYRPVAFNGGEQAIFNIPTEPLRGGIQRVALINPTGQVVADRFFFVYPKDSLSLTAETPDSAIALPFHKLTYRLKAAKDDGTPLKNVDLSVSVRDAINSDYKRNDDDLASNLLLTSDLKGYIPRPGFYLKDRKTTTQRLLDNMLIVHGWRRYDVTKEATDTAYEPKYLPEHSLVLNGRAKSTFQRSQDNLFITVLGQRDSIFTAGTTFTDKDGYFTLPLNSFDGDMNSFIQTSKQGKNRNRYTSVYLFRDFSPSPRLLTYGEEHTRWDSVPVNMARLFRDDSLYWEKANAGVITLGEVTVKAKNKRRNGKKDTETLERRLLGFYNVPRYIDSVRDKGGEVYEVDDLLKGLNPNVHVQRDSSSSLDEPIVSIMYGAIPMTFYVNGKKYDDYFFMKDVDAIKTIMIYDDNNISKNQVYSIDKNFQTRTQQVKDGWSGSDVEQETGVDNIKGGVVCSIEMRDHWNPQKVFKIQRGLRYTHIQGYSRPEAFYSPQYPDPLKGPDTDRRRTLFWSPDVKTDEQGVATVTCYNASQTTVPVIDAATIVDGHPLTVSFVK